MKKSFCFVAFMLLATMLQAQNEYRISQSIADSTHYCIAISAGWQVRIVQAEHSSVSIVTPCQVFYEEAAEPQVCQVDGRKLTILKNSSMPQSTIIEIAVKMPVQELEIYENASVTTEALLFNPHCRIDINQHATVRGTSWSGLGDMELNVWVDGSLHLEALRTVGELNFYRGPGATAECPLVEAAKGTLEIDRRSHGTDYASRTPSNLTVKSVNRNWMRNFNSFKLSLGVSWPYTVYTNAQYGSAYNFDQHYAVNLMASFGCVEFTKRLSLVPGVIYEISTSQLLNHVATDGKSLTVTPPASGLLPKQHLLTNHLGVNLGLSYGIGDYDKIRKIYDAYTYLALSFSRNFSTALISSVQGTDNHWNTKRETADVYNPWQLRAKVGLSLGGVVNDLVGTRIECYYDLLPTFRSGIGADDIHCLGITVGF